MNKNASTHGAPVTVDRFVTHVSTVPATAGQTVGLFLRERALPATLTQQSPHAVVMVHGGFAPSVVAYDLQYRDSVSWQCSRAPASTSSPSRIPATHRRRSR